MDLTDEAAARLAVNEVMQARGRVDVLVNAAGGFVWEKLQGGAMETWSRMHALNMVTCLNMTIASLPALMNSAASSIINIGALGALSPDIGMGGYGASKAAVHAMTEALAAECAGTALRVNAVLPSIIDTPANRADMPDADWASWVAPEAVADVIVFLASEQAAAVNGALIPLKLKR